MSRRLLSCLALLATLGAPRLACAEEMVWATGRVLDSAGKPVAGAVVAAYDDRNRVVDYAKADENGEYALAVPRSVLHLKKADGGFFHRVVQAVGGVGRIVTWPLKAGIRAAAGASTATDPVTKVSVGAASNLAQAIVDTLAPGERKRVTQLRQQPGVLVMKVSAPGRTDAVSIAKVYWMQEEVYRAGGKEQHALAAWMDPARMAEDGSDRPSRIQSDYLTFTGARLEPSIAEPGDKVTLTARMPLPPEPRTPVIVVARNRRNGHMVYLQRVSEGVYRGEFTVEPRFPKDDQVYTVLAYAEQDDEPGRSKKAEDAIARAGLWDPDKPFVYDPLLVVSRNRAEATLTVVAPPRRR